MWNCQYPMDCPPQLTTEMFRNYGIQLLRCTHLSRMMTGRIQEENLIVLMKQTGPPFKAETPSKACHWEFFWSPLRYGSAKMIYCRESHFTLLMLSGSHYCVPALKATTEIIVFFTHRTSCGSTSAALWKWWTWHRGAASVCHTGLSCHTLVGQ